jgi:putative ABC transport system ATP-binding protein
VTGSVPDVATTRAGDGNTVVIAKGVTKWYSVGHGAVVTAVDSVDLSVNPGEFVAIQGPSGSGKSTLLGLLAGLERPDAGTVEILGKPLEGLSERDRARLRRRHLGLVFQSFGLIGSLSVLQNVVLTLALEGVPEDEQRRRGVFALLDVDLGDRATSRIDDLSGGERQRVAIARALATDPLLILADEPTGSLDEASGADVLSLLVAAARSRNAALIVVTHDPDLAAMADRRYRMVDGELAEARS